jgi:hypothetical protein
LGIFPGSKILKPLMAFKAFIHEIN